MSGNEALGNTTTEYEEYDYDVTESWQTFFWVELCPTLIVYSLTMGLGIIGNSLIIFTIFRYRRMKSTTNVFLASLASADLLLIFICIPVKLAKLFSYTWTMGLFLCKTVHYMQNVSAICSVLTLTAMSLERYYAIVHPMKAKYRCTVSQASKVIFTIWLSSFLLAVPILFVQVQLTVGERIKAHWCVRNWDNPWMWKLHEMYMLLVILVIPSCVMAITYTVICWEMLTVIKKRYHMTSGKTNINYDSFRLECKRKTSFVDTTKADFEGNNTVKQVIKMLVCIIVVFVLCWGPLLIDNVLTAWGLLPAIRTGALKHMKTTFHLLAYFNSCINPVVYGFMSRNFRDSFSKALCRCYKVNPAREMSMTRTRTTSLLYADRSAIQLGLINH